MSTEPNYTTARKSTNDPLVENLSLNPHLRSHCIRIQYIVITS
jgi:hypothetical protein